VRVVAVHVIRLSLEMKKPLDREAWEAAAAPPRTLPGSAEE
jgi:hypothetical protein